MILATTLDRFLLGNEWRLKFSNADQRSKHRQVREGGKEGEGGETQRKGEGRRERGDGGKEREGEGGRGGREREGGRERGDGGREGGRGRGKRGREGLDVDHPRIFSRLHHRSCPGLRILLAGSAHSRCTRS